METLQKPRKRPGPPKRGYVDTHFLLPPELLEWAKFRPEGLGGLVRRLLQEAKDAEDRREG